MQRDIKRNTGLLWSENVLTSTALLVGNGTIFHSFLMFAGLSSEKIGLYSTAVQISQAAIMLIATSFLDKVRRLRGLYLGAVLSQVLYYAIMLCCCRGSFLTGNAFYIVAVGMAIMLNLLVGLRAVMCYKLPYMLIDMRNYGRYSVTQAMLVSTAGILFSYAASKAFDVFEFLPVMRVLLVAGGVMAVFSALCVGLFRPHTPEMTYGASKKASIMTVLTDKRFYAYVMPNFLRGVGTGILTMIVLFARQDLQASESFMSKFVLAAQISAFLSYFLYRVLIKKLSSRQLNMVGGILFALMPLMAFTTNTTLYMAIYFVVNVGLGFFSVAIPVVVAENIEFEIAGTYTSGRLLLNSAGTALGTYLCGILVGKLPSAALFGAAALMQLICSVAYTRFGLDKKSA